LKEAIKNEGPFESERAAGIARAISNALALAHKSKIIHRDLKPQNIMLSRDREGHEIPKLLDFGIAKTFETDSTALTSTGMVLGTPQYMSPEQAEGKPVDTRADLYALGIILYEMLVGKVPFDAPSVPAILVKHLKEPPQPPSKLRESIPPNLESIVLRCLAKEPEKRFATADELSAALESTDDTVVKAEEGPTEGIPALSTALQEPPTEISPSPPPPAPRDLPPIPATAPHPSEAPSRDVTVRSPSKRSSSWRWGVLAIAALAVAAIIVALLNRNGQDSESQSASMSLPQPESATEPQTHEAASSSEPEESSVSVEEQPTEPSVSKPAPLVMTDKGQGASAEETRASKTIATPPPSPSPQQQVDETQEVTAPAPLPSVPSVSMSCDGVADACAAIGNAFQSELERRKVPFAQFDPAEIEIAIFAEEVEARQEQQFGTLMVVRTYSIEMTGKAPRFRELVPMPQPETLSFDARFGKEKLNERSRVIASNVADKIQAYWSRKKQQ
jgi:serine/threonine-protein kinase